MGKRYNREPSDAQLNAEALARRGSSFTEASGRSFAIAWDWHNREPRDLRECVRLVRQAYADEVPTRLHEGYDSIGEGGTPKMDVRAEGYIFGRDDAGETPKGKCACPDGVWDGGENMTQREVTTGIPLLLKARSNGQQVVVIDYGGVARTWVWKAILGHASECPAAPPAIDYYRTPFRATLAKYQPDRARLVSHVAIGSQSPIEAAMREGVPQWCARMVAEDTLRGFIRSLSDVKVSEAVA